METEYIVVQAGGKGTRMEQLTRNKPKALVPVNNLPMLFHLFRKYPKKKFIIIGDYKFDVLQRYLAAFADVDYQLVCGTGCTGTCAGLKEAVGLVPQGRSFLLIWSDLVLPEEFSLPEEAGNYIGVAKDFPCRWKFENGEFQEERSDMFGVAGLFVFEDKNLLSQVPESGEFVRWLSGQSFEKKELELYRTKEYGLISEYRKMEIQRCRPFNRISVENGVVTKEGIDEQGRKLAVRECAWYQKVMDQHFAQIPKIYSLTPLRMEKIDGENVYTYTSLSHQEKADILAQIITCLKSVQALEAVPADRASYEEAYIGKTFDRLDKIWDLVPFAREKTVTVNGKVCRNVLYHRQELEEMVARYFPEKFKLIHGDCTFSNTMLKQDLTPVLIDPRGYFGMTEFFGDPAYDWAKLYYSVVGNYDQFNLKRFTLDIGESEVKLDIESTHWEDMEPDFFEMLKDEVTPEQIKLFHAIIWLSLTTYAWEDYDSICGAFYNGLYYLEDVL